MVFTSQIFLFYFLPLVLALYYLLPVRARNGFLTLASYVFYGWWSPWFVLLMLASTLVDWQCGKMVAAPGATDARRRLGVTLSAVVNLALLGFFKYFLFAQVNLNQLLLAVGREPVDPWHIVLPIGISFYTFQSMSYTIDLYRGHAQRARSLQDFACYVSLFPQLIAGPIVRYQFIAEQLHDRPQRGQEIREGCLYFMLGFAKKVLLANTLGEIAELAFANQQSLPAHAAWFGLIAFNFQVYFDFSGYSDMAIGLGRLFGFRLPINFRSPFRAESFTQFWQRWHLTLTAWLRDYLYVPLANTRVGPRLAIVLTMLLGGLWHGAEWHYVLWGMAHGTLLLVERLVPGRCLYWFLPRVLRVACTVLLVHLTGLLFAPDLGDRLSYFATMFSGSGAPAAQALASGQLYQPFYLFAVLACGIATWAGRETRVLVQKAATSWTVASFAILVFLWSVVAMFSQADNPFLYFQF